MLFLLMMTRLPCYAGWHRTLEECAALLFTECINSGSPNTGWQRSLPGWILGEHVARYKCALSHSSVLVWYLSQCGPLRWNYCHSWQDDSLQVIKEVMIQKHLADSEPQTDSALARIYQTVDNICLDCRLSWLTDIVNFNEPALCAEQNPGFCPMNLPSARTCHQCFLWASPEYVAQSGYYQDLGRNLTQFTFSYTRTPGADGISRLSCNRGTLACWRMY